MIRPLLPARATSWSVEFCLTESRKRPYEKRLARDMPVVAEVDGRNKIYTSTSSSRGSGLGRSWTSSWSIDPYSVKLTAFMVIISFVFPFHL